MLNSNIAPEESQDLGFVFHHHLTSQDRAAKDHYADILSISGYIGKMHLADGSVLADNTVDCVPETIVTSPNAKVFVIPNDRDYERTLDAPFTFHVKFILVPDPVGLAAYNTISEGYPGIYNGSQKWVTPVHSFPAGGLCSAFRLFRVLRDPVIL
jgi:hypothetical protein